MRKTVKVQASPWWTRREVIKCSAGFLSSGAATKAEVARRRGSDGRLEPASPPESSTVRAQFVSLVYRDLLRREVDSVGLARWTTELEQGLSPAAAVAKIQSSTEYRTILIDDLYRAFLGRPVDTAGLRAHLASFDPKRSATHVLEVILTSPEYYHNRAGGNDRMFLTALHFDLLGRNTDQSLIAWEQAMEKGASRLEVVRRILFGKEATERTVRRLFQRHLLREAGSNELRHYSTRLQQGTAPELILPDLLGSSEYVKRSAATLSSLDERATRLVTDLVSDLFARRATGRDYAAWLSRFQDALVGRRSLTHLAHEMILSPEAARGTLANWRLLDADGPTGRWRGRAQGASEIAKKWLRLAAKRGVSVDQAAEKYWTDRIVKANHYESVLAEFLSSEDYLGFPPDLYANSLRCWNPPPGTFALHVHRQDPPPAEPFRPGQPILAASYFYWYDSIHGMDYLVSPDPEKHSDGKLALTIHPPTLEGFSYRLVDWHERQLRDMREAGIDVVLPVFFGSPFTEPRREPGERERSWNRRSEFSEPGLRNIVRACDRLAKSAIVPPRIAMFYDTSTLYRDNAKLWHVTLNSLAGKRWFYETIRNFFSLVPARLWANIDGRPMVWVYHPSFGQHVEEDLYPKVREWFEADFGVDPYIVTAAEEEAPRVVDPASLKPWVAKLTEGRPYFDVLASLLGEPEFFNKAGATPGGFVTRLYQKFLGRIPNPEEGRQDLDTLARESRTDFARRFLKRADVLTSLVAGWRRRYLRVDAAADARHVDPLSRSLMDRLALGEDYFSVLAALLSSSEFLVASGGTEEYLIDNLYQQVVWKCPNPGCAACSTTSTGDEGKKHFLARLRATSRSVAIQEFLRREEVFEATVSGWFFDYLGRFNPGPADNSFYWSAAICPTIRGVASIGPGYDQSGLRGRPRLTVPRREGEQYKEVWNKILAMSPRPWIVHIESWNEMFEGTAICETKEYGRKYIEMTREYSALFHKGS